MHSLGVFGRLLSRTIVNGLYSNCSSTSPTSTRANSTSVGVESSSCNIQSKLVSAVAGFPKDFKSGKVRKGKIGDDAWLLKCVNSTDILGNSFSFLFENWLVMLSILKISFAAVADGVGGWRDYGVDPGDFSYSLLRSVDHVTNVSKNWSARNPVVLLATAFRELLHSKRPITGKRLQPFIWIEIFLLNFSFDNMFAGSSTACVLFLDHDSSRLFTVNIGDSGFLVVRKGRVVHQSEEQQHYFNTPFQLALPPPGHDGSALNDRY